MLDFSLLNTLTKRKASLPNRKAYLKISQRTPHWEQNEYISVWFGAQAWHTTLGTALRQGDKAHTGPERTSVKELQGKARKFTKDSEGAGTDHPAHRGRSSFLRPFQVSSAPLRLGVGDSHTIVTACHYRTACTVPARLHAAPRRAQPGPAEPQLPLPQGRQMWSGRAEGCAHKGRGREGGSRGAVRHPPLGGKGRALAGSRKKRPVGGGQLEPTAARREPPGCLSSDMPAEGELPSAAAAGAELGEPQYLRQVQHILQHGHRKEDRTGTGTISVFGMQARYSLRGWHHLDP